jgi:hypothetical protein
MERHRGKTTQSSSLPLHVLLFYNSLFSVVYWVLMSFIISTKLLYKLKDRTEVYIVSSFVLYTVGDVMRLPFALWGNQKEQVPALAASLLMSLFPTVPALLYLTFFQEKVFPFELIGGCVQFCFIIMEFPLLWSALRKNANVQLARFVRLTLEDPNEQDAHLD